MIAELFLVCALATPAANFPRVHMVEHNYIHDELEQLQEWIRQNNPGAEIHIVQGDGDSAILKKNGWERLPFSWRGCQVWIRRKPYTDEAPTRAVEESA